MANRRFEGLTDQQLRDAERNFEKAARKWKKEDDRWWREGRVSDRSWETNSEYQNILRNKELCDKDIREVREEWEYRRSIRIQKARAAEQRQKEQARDRPPLVPMACACQRSRRIMVTQRDFEGGPILCGVCNQPFQRHS
jgi:integrase